MPQASLELASVAQLIGQLWLREINQTTLDAMGTKPFRETYEELGGFIPEPNESLMDELAVEYCVLLIGPKGQLSPVQSVWQSNQFQSETSSSMKQYFELLPNYEPGSSLPDHIGVQLDFLSHLLRQSDEATDEIVRQFVQSHLQWSSVFLAQVQQRESKFYQGLARVTDGLINSI